MSGTIVQIGGITVAGVRREMSFADDATSEIWRKLNSCIDKIPGRKGTDRYSIQVYGRGFSFSEFDPARRFEKWAAVEIADAREALPPGLEHFLIPEGDYAVFEHRGGPRTASATFSMIFADWLPASGFQLDERPHFERIPLDWSPFDEDAVEDIFIPIKTRQDEMK